MKFRFSNVIATKSLAIPVCDKVIGHRESISNNILSYLNINYPDFCAFHFIQNCQKISNVEIYTLLLRSKLENYQLSTLFKGHIITLTKTGALVVLILK